MYSFFEAKNQNVLAYLSCQRRKPLNRLKVINDWLPNLLGVNTILYHSRSYRMA